MNRFGLALLALVLAASPLLADRYRSTTTSSQISEGVVLETGNAARQSTGPVTAANPLPVTGTVTVDTSALATAARQDTGNTSLGTVATNTGTTATNTAALALTNAITNPTSTLTRPADTTAYAQNDLIASSTTAGSVVVPSFAIANSAGGAAISRLRLTTSVTTGWGNVSLRVTLWSAAPTYTNGDNGAYAVATGAASRLAAFDCTLSQSGDGASGSCSINVGSYLAVKLASGTSIFWDIQYLGSASLTPISAQTFTLRPEVLN